MPEDDPRNGIYATECQVAMPKFFDIRTMHYKTYLMHYKTYLQQILEVYAAMVRSHHAKLVIVFQPVACVLGTGAGTAEARAVIDQFKRENPDVDIPFPLVSTWPADMFSVPAHVRHEYTDRISDRLGEAMAAILARDGITGSASSQPRQ
jgi:hypothetical protein